MDFINKIKDEFTHSSSSSGSGSEQDWYITVVRGEGIKDDGFFTRSDPYLKVEFAGKNFRTHALKSERSPDWNETFHFQVKRNQGQDIILTLMDDELGFDGHMGRAVISQEDLPRLSNDEKHFQVPIKKNDQITGLIHLRVKLIDNNVQQQQQSSNVSSFQSTNLPYQQESRLSGNFPNQTSAQVSSGYQQQPMSYDGLSTQPQYQGQQLQGQSSQQYPGTQFQQGSTNPLHHHHHHDQQQQQSDFQQQSNFQQRSNDNYYGKQ